MNRIVCRSILALFFAALSVMMLTGCGQYVLRGRVVKGGISMVSMVEPNDASLELGEPIQGAEIALWRDPDQLNRERVAVARSGADGWFTMPVSAFGTGWMDERWEIRSTAGGHQRAEQFISLPGSSNTYRVLVILSPGAALPSSREEDLLDEYERFR